RWQWRCALEPVVRRDKAFPLLVIVKQDEETLCEVAAPSVNPHFQQPADKNVVRKRQCFAWRKSQGWTTFDIRFNRQPDLGNFKARWQITVEDDEALFCANW